MVERMREPAVGQMVVGQMVLRSFCRREKREVAEGVKRSTSKTRKSWI